MGSTRGSLKCVELTWVPTSNLTEIKLRYVIDGANLPLSFHRLVSSHVFLILSWLVTKVNQTMKLSKPPWLKELLSPATFIRKCLPETTLGVNSCTHSFMTSLKMTIAWKISKTHTCLVMPSKSAQY